MNDCIWFHLEVCKNCTEFACPKYTSMNSDIGEELLRRHNQALETIYNAIKGEVLAEFNKATRHIPGGSPEYIALLEAAEREIAMGYLEEESQLLVQLTHLFESYETLNKKY